MDEAETQRSAVIEILVGDTRLAHATLFPRRHRLGSADCHHGIIDTIHGPQAHVLIEGFRGIGKTTLLEEAVILLAAERVFKNIVIVGASYGRACDRVEAIANEFVINEELQRVFGILK